jgi:hypothetical protein
VTSGPDDTPALSLVVATVSGWSDYAPVFRGHRAAIEAVGGELVVIDGSDAPEPGAADLGPATTWVKAPGQGVFQAHAQAFPMTRGSIVASTEDHCYVDVAWGRTILDLHLEYPEASVIGGVVENGSTRTLNDWALFLSGHYRDIPGVGTGRRVAMAGVTAISYKREALTGLEAAGESGVNEAHHQRQLTSQGRTVLIDDRLRVRHVQARTTREALSIHWHAARSAAALRRERPTALGLLRVLAAPLQPAIFWLILGRAVMERRYARRQFLAATPLILAMYGVRAAAEVTGTVAGAGDSRTRFP